MKEKGRRQSIEKLQSNKKEEGTTQSIEKGEETKQIKKKGWNKI